MESYVSIGGRQMLANVSLREFCSIHYEADQPRAANKGIGCLVTLS